MKLAAMKTSEKPRAEMLAREPAWIGRLRASRKRRKYILWFAGTWAAIIAMLWLLNAVLT